MRTRPLLGSILCVLTAVAGLATSGCKKLEASKAETTNAAVQADPTPKSAPTVAASASPTPLAQPAEAPAVGAAGQATCAKIAWSGGDLPDGKGAKLAGTIKLTRAKTGSGEMVEVVVMLLDKPVCDPRGEPVREIQVGEGKLSGLASFAGKHVTVAFDGFITGRSDEVHFRPIIGDPSSTPPDVGASAAAADKCAALAWSKGDMPTAAVTELTGKLGSAGPGTGVRGSKEEYFVLELDAPVCAADGSAQTDVQVIPETIDQTEHARISKLVGKAVTVSGQAEEAVTAHHHRPVVVFGKITAR